MKNTMLEGIVKEAQNSNTQKSDYNEETSYRILLD